MNHSAKVNADRFVWLSICLYFCQSFYYFVKLFPINQSINILGGYGMLFAHAKMRKDVA